VSLLSNKSEVREFNLSITIALIAFATAFLAFGVRLWFLEILHGEEYRRIALEIATLQIPKPAPRGMIFDTTGQRLADNRASFDLKIIPSYVKTGPDQDALAEKIANLLVDTTPDDVDAAIEAGRAYNKFVPAMVKADLSWPEVAAIESYRNEIPGIEI